MCFNLVFTNKIVYSILSTHAMYSVLFPSGFGGQCHTAGPDRLPEEICGQGDQVHHGYRYDTIPQYVTPGMTLYRSM